jgi:signal transduction histidine kinase
MKRTVRKSTRRATMRSASSVSVLQRRQMENELREAEERVALSALDGLSTHIAILDARGRILAINKAWREFAREKKDGTDHGGVGTNYFVHCKSGQNNTSAFTKFSEGVQAVVRGKRDEFSMEYPCHVRGEERWFQGKVTRFAGQGPVLVIIAHEDISHRVRLEREIVAVSGREQQRFGQELHDGLSQQLTGLKFKASLLEYQLQSKGLPEARDAKAISHLLNEATEEASKLARSVRPVEVESRGLMMALRELAANTENARDVSCTCEFRRPVFIHDNNVATNVYRIVEEAIANALRHGNARQIWITLSETKDCVTLCVRDDGEGLPPKFSEDGGLGLHMMRYRARMIGGSVELRRNPTGGSMMTCSFQKRPVAILAKKRGRLQPH